WLPLTEKPVALLVIVPAERLPSPQSMMAENWLAVALGSPLLKSATAPVKGVFLPGEAMRPTTVIGQATSTGSEKVTVGSENAEPPMLNAPVTVTLRV